MFWYRRKNVQKNNEKFMKEAIKEAKKAYDKLEIPVGAVIVKDGKIISRAYNQKETKFDTTKHAEILAIQKASKKLGAWRLLDCDMYVTLEPCSMCAGAIINSRIKKVYIGTSDEKTGAVGSVFNLFEDYTFNHKVEFEKGIMKEECEAILKQFFKELRKNKKRRKKECIEQVKKYCISVS
jgi:tRNA(adenine34) deaminase